MKRRSWVMAAAMAVLALGSAAQAVTIGLVPVTNPGNAADPSTGFGAVPYDYSIGKYDVTAGQYTAFLNAVATTDTYGLYNSNMAAVGSGGGGTFGCGIIQSGGSGSYTYAVAAAYQNFPVNYVSFWDAARFCNWLQNGQPTGLEGPGTTETGAYTLNDYNGNDGRTITRNSGATWYLPSENEWYKAAYYNPSNASYWLYPTQSNTAPINILSSTGTNNANLHDAYGTGNGGYTDPVNYLTPVGAFADSPGPYGTYDTGGNVWEWDESSMGPSRALRGGGWNGISNYLASSIRAVDPPSYEVNCLGFRVASVSFCRATPTTTAPWTEPTLASCCRITTRPARPGPKATSTATVRSMARTSTLCCRITIRALGCPPQVLRCPSRLAFCWSYAELWRL